MKFAEIKLPFGLNKDGNLVHIADVAKGIACECLCPSCRTPLLAAKGAKYQHHFRHSADKDCATGLESAIHLAAKKMLVEKKQITLPQLVAKLEGRDSRGYPHSAEEIVLAEGAVIQFDSVQEEVLMHGMKFDILATKGGVPLAIEIFYRHKVDPEKISKIELADISVIEIDLSSLTVDDVNNWESFWTALNDPSRAKWIYNAKGNRIRISKLKDKLQESILADEHKYRKRDAEIKVKLEQERRQFVRALEKVEYLRSPHQIQQLRIQAETHPVIKNQNPEYFLAAEVPNGDWIFGCERRIWQTLIYKNFICDAKRLQFTLPEVHDWLKLYGGCKIAREVVIVAKGAENHSRLLPSDLAVERPSSWRTLRKYFEYLCKLRILSPIYSQTEKKFISAYRILSTKPMGNDTSQS